MIRLSTLRLTFWSLLLCALVLCWRAETFAAQAGQPGQAVQPGQAGQPGQAESVGWIAAPTGNASRIRLERDVVINTAFLQDGPSLVFTSYLQHVIQQFAALGLAPPAPTHAPLSATDLWRVMSQHDDDTMLRFLEDGVYDCEWSPEKRADEVARIAKRIRTRGDIDLLVVMGDWSSQEISGLEHSVATLSINSSTMALEQERADYQGKVMRLYAHLESKSFNHEELNFFHDIRRFKTLGVIYDPSPMGRDIADIEVLRAAADEKGYTLRECATTLLGVDQVAAAANFMGCLADMEGDIDAFFMHEGPPLNPGDRHAAFERLAALGAPVYAQVGEADVRLGALLGPSRSSLERQDKRFAYMLSRMMRSMRTMVSMASTMPMKIVLNMDTARRVDYMPAPNVLLLCEVIVAENLPTPAAVEASRDATPQQEAP